MNHRIVACSESSRITVHQAFFGPDFYWGEMRGGYPHGYGLYRFGEQIQDDGKMKTLEMYSGHFQYGRLHGRGTYVFQNGDVIQGILHNNKISQILYLKTHDGLIFDGHTNSISGSRYPVFFAMLNRTNSDCRSPALFAEVGLASILENGISSFQEIANAIRNARVLNSLNCSEWGVNSQTVYSPQLLIGRWDKHDAMYVLKGQTLYICNAFSVSNNGSRAPTVAKYQFPSNELVSECLSLLARHAEENESPASSFQAVEKMYDAYRRFFDDDVLQVNSVLPAQHAENCWLLNPHAAVTIVLWWACQHDYRNFDLQFARYLKPGAMALHAMDTLVRHTKEVNPDYSPRHDPVLNQISRVHILLASYLNAYSISRNNDYLADEIITRYGVKFE